MAVDSINPPVGGKKEKKLVVLLILDGWGLSPTWGGNAIAMNNPKNINGFWRQYPHAILHAFKPIAGASQNVANSEIGHASIGTGRMINQDITDIDQSIKDSSFYENQQLIDACQNAKDNNSSLHLIGMISDGAVHSHINHLYALLKLAKKEGVKDVYIHAILDGRDVEPNSALKYLNDLENKIIEIGIGKIATLCGRYYAMDRNKNWKLIEEFYKALVKRVGRKESDPLKAISEIYREGLSDEFIPPIIIFSKNPQLSTIKSKDSVVLFNYRADRIRELMQAFVDKKVFRGVISRKYPLLDIHITSMTDYKLSNSKINIAFPSTYIESNISKIISDHGLNQLHAAESEKYAHVTYFFNGGQESSYANEDRIIVESPHKVNYAESPEMSAYKLTNKLISAIRSKKYSFIVANLANVDMIGHTGDILAASKAVQVVDECVGKIVKEIAKLDGITIITADHGNAEQMVTINSMQKDLETLHSLNPVPFILIGKNYRKHLFSTISKPNEFILSDILSTTDSLADIAPTILDLFNIAKPTDMTGHSLLKELS